LRAHMFPSSFRFSELTVKIWYAFVLKALFAING
jgi:hypothetical protein